MSVPKRWGKLLIKLSIPSPFWLLVALLVLTFLLGGGARADIQSLVILRPTAVMFCVLGVLSLNRRHVRSNRFLLGMAAAIVSLVLIHLIPLPPSIWSVLPGRGLVTEIDRIAQLGEVWRPISMAPTATWNAFYSLFVPLAALLLGIQLSQEERVRLLPILLGCGLVSGFLGLLQSIGDPQGPLYLYRISNNGSAVGLFANRNHQAVFLAIMFPLLAVYAYVGVRTEEHANVRRYAAVISGLLLIPLLLVTGSRAGLVIGVLGLTTTFVLYRKPTITAPKKRTVSKTDLRWIWVSSAIACLGALTFIMSRAQAITRILAPDQVSDLRFRMWPYIGDMAWKYFPVGSGVGSFVEVYQVDEPYALLSTDYVNHAHNDWLEIYLTGGMPALALVAVALLAAAKSGGAAFRNPIAVGTSNVFARLGMVIIVFLALGSTVDYPLRTPSLSIIFVVAVIWLAGYRNETSKIAGSR
jgi:O-antigen ligase